jgi:hypothetical protein
MMLSVSMHYLSSSLLQQTWKQFSFNDIRGSRTLKTREHSHYFLWNHRPSGYDYSLLKLLFFFFSAKWIGSHVAELFSLMDLFICYFVNYWLKIKYVLNLGSNYFFIFWCYKILHKCMCTSQNALMGYKLKNTEVYDFILSVVFILLD